jgi:hypothetical protein
MRDKRTKFSGKSTGVVWPGVLENNQQLISRKEEIYHDEIRDQN